MRSATMLVYVLLAALSLQHFGSSMKIMLGPFRIQGKAAEDCDHPETYPIRIVGNKIRKFNRTTYTYSADLISSETIDDDLKITLRLAVFGNGGWKKNYFVLSAGGMCSAVRKLTPEMRKVIQAMLKTSCPVPPGNYTISNLITTVDLHWPSLPLDTYKITLDGNKMNRPMFCKTFLVDILPKRRGMIF